MKKLISTTLILISFQSFSQEYPKTFPNGGNMGSRDWSIEDYINNAKEDSIIGEKNRIMDKNSADYFKNYCLKGLENEHLNKHKLTDAKNKINTTHENSIKKIDSLYNGKLFKIKTYRDEWTKYLNAKIEQEKILKTKLEAKEKAIEIENAEKARQSSIKADEELKKYLNIGNTIEYKTWKTKYLNLIQSANLNVNICNQIIKKHTFRNMFGEKKYESSTFTKQEKTTFNKNLDLLGNKNNQIRELENNNYLYSYFTNKATEEEVSKSYNLSTFYNTTSKCY